MTTRRSLSCSCGRNAVPIQGMLCWECIRDGRGSPLPAPHGAGGTPTPDDVAPQADVSPGLTLNDAAGHPAVVIRGDGSAFVRGLHAAGKPQHHEPSRSRTLRWAYGSGGLALVCASLYLLAGFVFGDTGRAVVAWVLVVASLLTTAGVGLVLFAAAMPDGVKEDGDA